MNISGIKIRKIYQTGRLKALVSVTIDEDLAVHDIKIIEGPERLFVAMPSRREANGTFRDIVHPITQTARHTLERYILDEYARQAVEAELNGESINTDTHGFYNNQDDDNLDNHTQQDSELMNAQKTTEI